MWAMSCTISAETLCSSCLCPNAPHPHVERRYLIVPGLRFSRVYVIDTEPDQKNPKFFKHHVTIIHAGNRCCDGLMV